MKKLSSNINKTKILLIIVTRQLYTPSLLLFSAKHMSYTQENMDYKFSALVGGPYTDYLYVQTRALNMANTVLVVNCCKLVPQFKHLLLQVSETATPRRRHKEKTVQCSDKRYLCLDSHTCKMAHHMRWMIFISNGVLWSDLQCIFHNPWQKVSCISDKYRDSMFLLVEAFASCL